MFGLHINRKDKWRFIERMVNQELWYAIIGNQINDVAHFSNDTFEYRPYSWNDEWNTNECHFWHKPSGTKLRWYKYPLRSVECNRKLTHEQLYAVLYDCTNSLHPDLRTVINRWWDKRKGWM